MAVTLSVTVMAHPRRRGLVSELVRALDVEPQVVWDQYNDEWDTGRRALLSYDPGATHHLVVQDDAIVCRDLGAAATRAADAVGERPVSFYTGRVKPHPQLVSVARSGALVSGATWLQMPGPWWGVALMLPTDHIKPMVKWADRYGQHIADYDRRIARWYSRASVACWYSTASLVDHRPESESPSLLANHAINRTAHGFIGRDKSGLDVQWRTDAFIATPRRNIR